MPDLWDDPDLDQWRNRFRVWLGEFDADERRMLPVGSARSVVTVALPEAAELATRLAGVGR